MTDTGASFEVSIKGVGMSFPGRLALETQSPGGGGALDAGNFLFPLSPAGNNYQISSDGATRFDYVSDGDRGSAYNEIPIDLAGKNDVRLVAYVSTPGSAGTQLGLVYTDDAGATVHDLVAGGFYIDVDATGWIDSGWQPIVAGAKAAVGLRPSGLGGDNWVTPATMYAVYLQFR